MKTGVGVRRVAIIAALAVTQSAAAAVSSDEVRGGWIADIDGQRHVLLLNVRGTDIKGISCRDCANPENLSFVLEGKLEADGFSFVILHDVGAGAPYRETAKGKIVNGRLVLSVQRQGSNTPAKQMTMMREPRRPSSGLVLPGAVAPLPEGVAPSPSPAPVVAVGPGRGGPAVAVPGGGGTNTPAPVPVPGGLPAGARGGGRGTYVPPGPNETLTPAKVVGLWLWGTGPGKQYFMFRQVGSEIRGMVCGPCDNPFTFGVLADGAIAGDVFRFNIVHEDWGISIQNGPFNNQATATISMNEMHIATRQDNQPATTPTLDMTLLGPVAPSRAQ